MDALGVLLCSLEVAVAAAPVTQGPPTIVVATAPGGWSEAEQRTRAELELAGFKVVLADSDDRADRRAELDELAQAHGAVAALRIDRSKTADPSVDLWLVDRVTAKANFRRLEPGGKQVPDAEEVALEIVELLHASFLEIEVDDRPPAGVEAPPEVVSFVKRPRTPARGAVRAGVFVAGGPGGLPPTAGPTIGGTWGFHPWLVLDADLQATALQGRVASESGRSNVGLAWARLGFGLRPWSTARVHPIVSLGGGPAVAWALGEAQPGYTSSNAVSASGMLGGGVDLVVALARRVRLRLGVHASAILPEIKVRHQGEVQARFGRPWIDGVFAIEWTWPS